MVATVTALDDCTIAVTSAPLSAPRSALEVERCSSSLRPSPPNSLRPSVIMAIASRNRASPPAASSTISMAAV